MTDINHNQGGIVVAYGGVHQSFQIALAAQEMGALDCFYCAAFDAPGKWGGHLSRLFGADVMRTRRGDGIPAAKVIENPWPWMAQRIRGGFSAVAGRDWHMTNGWFDRWAARQLSHSSARLFVGVETCAMHCLETARKLGIKRVLDCPQFHPAFLERVMQAGADNLGLPRQGKLDGKAMQARKEREFCQAEYFLVYSDVHRRSFEQAGVPAKRIFQCPLWVDTKFWHPATEVSCNAARPLKVLFAGGLGLRKGVVYLLRAADACGPEVSVTLVGAAEAGLDRLLVRKNGPLHRLGPQTKVSLREIYRDHDVFVLPSLADTFGFVALEAMACGRPVVVTDNCGVPVPHESWRVPVMNAEAIAGRLLLYARDRELCREHGRMATRFAAQYTPERYRHQLQGFFRQLLENGNG